MWKKTAFQVGLMALDYGMKKRKKRKKTNKRRKTNKKKG
jgi:hypothetical protein